MARWDSADLLAKLKRLLKLPAVTEQAADTDLYEYLAQAQEEEIAFWAPRVPEPFYGPWVKLATADNGLTYTFGLTPSGSPVTPIGHFELRASRDGEVLFPGADWHEGRFVWNGQSITWPRGKPRLFGDGPYAKFVNPHPAPIAAATQPVIPELFRQALPPAAAVHFAEEGGALRDPTPFERKLARARAQIGAAIGTAPFGVGAPAVEPAGDRWWDFIDDRPENYTRTG